MTEPTWKHAQAPAGAPMVHRTKKLGHLKDCPVCTYGTLDWDRTANKWRCADCKAAFAERNGRPVVPKFLRHR